MDSTDKDGIRDPDWDDTVAAICEPTPIDPRRGLPSASAMVRIAACPGSYLASTLCPPSPDNADSTSGTRIHAALETGDTSSLSADESETADMCRHQTNVLLEAWSTPDVVPAMHLEQRLGLTALGGVVEVTDATTARLVCTGQADLVVVERGRAIVIDYKTGRGDYEHAAGNAQLRTLASLVARRYRVASVRVAIVQPWAGQPTVADFDAEALEAAHEWLADVLVKALRATPQDLRAGEWCHWCPANARCTTFRETALAPVERLTMSLPSDDKTARAALFARAMELPADVHARLMRGLRLVAWYSDAIEGAAKVRAKDDAEFQAFYHLEEGDKVREVTDTGAVFGLLEAHGLTQEAFLSSCVTIKVGPLDEAIQKAGGPNIKADGTPGKRYAITGKQATDIVTSTLTKAGVLKMKRNAAKLVETAKQLQEVE